MITIKNKGGDFSKTKSFLEKIMHPIKYDLLHHYGEQGVAALAASTPKDTGLTAASWSYTIEENNRTITLSFNNSNVNDGVVIAIILQYGHGTGNGGWVEGRDYINPAVRPIFDKLANDAWKEVVER